MTTIAYTVIGTIRSGLLSTGIEIASLNGEQRYREMGSAIYRGWILGAIAMVPITAILINVERILIATGTEPAVANLAQQYFYYLLPCAPAISFITCDQQFALAIKKPIIPLIMGPAYIGLSMAIGFTLTLFTPLGVKGLAIGTSASARVAFIALRAYYFF